MKEKIGKISYFRTSIKGEPVQFVDPVCPNAEKKWLAYSMSDEEIYPRSVKALDYDTGEIIWTTVINKGEKDDFGKQAYGEDTQLALTGDVAGYILINIDSYLDFLRSSDGWKISFSDDVISEDLYLITRPLLNLPSYNYAEKVMKVLVAKGIYVDEEMFMRNCKGFTLERGDWKTDSPITMSSSGIGFS